MKINSKSQKVGILGAGRQAAETAGYLVEEGYEIEFFFVETKYREMQTELSSVAPIVSENDNLEPYKDTIVFSAVGSPLVRKRLVELWPYNNFGTFVHNSAWVAQSAKIGIDVVVPPLAAVNANAQLGNHVLLNIGVTVSHDTILGEYATLSPGVNIAGKVNVGEGSFFGIGSAVVEDITIGSGAVIAAGSSVNKDVEDLVMVAGVPAVKKKEIHNWYE